MGARTAKGIQSALLSAVMLAAGVAFFFLAGHRPPPAPSVAEEAGGSVRVTILHTNDSHGQLGGLVVGGRQIGGAARLATAIQKARQASTATRVLLVDGGDLFSRGDELSRRTVGAANVAVMNHLRYDLWVLGNGEFYDGLAVLRHRMAEANFQTLAANVSVSGEPLAKAYVIERVGPARLAFFGLCTVREESQAYFGIDEADPIETARALVPQLRRQADVVVAVTHLGLPQDVRLAGAVDGIDLILGAHDHKVLQHGFRAKGPSEREVLICQAGDKYRYLGQVDLELVPRLAGGGYQLASARAKLIALDETVPPDPATEALLARMAQAASLPASPGLVIRTVPEPATQPGTIPTSAPAPTAMPAATSPAMVPAAP